MGCGCFTDIKVCICVWFIPCYVHGKTAEAMGKSCLLHTVCVLIPILDIYDLTCIRSEALGENILISLIVSFFLWPLSVCQVARVKNPTSWRETRKIPWNVSKVPTL